ncbi:hypothetical protein CSAL01_05567 [Colletotrichum salicis]|uniref:Uncharacterized protein n=1 Tax=Colletotrichum salicis TaxID=1209931 RepID=A0A135V5U3_9PEZI|nr:hypothetical protein CSAL01_05567 [Colletotrichum salicis]
MGNMESRQFADALLRACQEISGDSGDIPPDRLLVPEAFLEQIKSNWDKLPSSAADIVKDKFIPRFGPKDDPKGDPEAWVQQQIVREPDNDFPIHLYDELVSISLSRTPFEVARRNVLLVAFSNLQAKGDSGLDRSALTRYLAKVKEKGSEGEIRKIRKNCSFVATAGDRLKSCLGKVGALEHSFAAWPYPCRSEPTLQARSRALTDHSASHIDGTNSLSRNLLSRSIGIVQNGAEGKFMLY